MDKEDCRRVLLRWRALKFSYEQTDLVINSIMSAARHRCLFRRCTQLCRKVSARLILEWTLARERSNLSASAILCPLPLSNNSMTGALSVRILLMESSILPLNAVQYWHGTEFGEFKYHWLCEMSKYAVVDMLPVGFRHGWLYRWTVFTISFHVSPY